MMPVDGANRESEFLGTQNNPIFDAITYSIVSLYVFLNGRKKRIQIWNTLSVLCSFVLFGSNPIELELLMGILYELEHHWN